MADQQHSIRAQRFRVWMCVLLAAFILYNPFAALCFSHGAVEVHSLQRNRATVGASELQHFSPVQDDNRQTDLNLEANPEEVAAPAESFVARGFEQDVELPQSDIAFTIWSRPPPLA
ncbi:MAG TPA: hypothetical protein VNI81_01450 [Candidatus Limnocylindrales bacterium]|jgi:hypothetical protein|nr:hypothetical protein [Candidatus Limnocylindrales bacterium]